MNEYLSSNFRRCVKCQCKEASSASCARRRPPDSPRVSCRRHCIKRLLLAVRSAIARGRSTPGPRVRHVRRSVGGVGDAGRRTRILSAAADVRHSTAVAHGCTDGHGMIRLARPGSSRRGRKMARGDVAGNGSASGVERAVRIFARVGASIVVEAADGANSPPDSVASAMRRRND